jgi:chromosome segregation ATPase
MKEKRIVRRSLQSLIAVLALAISSCGISETESAALQQAEDAMLARDSMEATLVETMDDINKNLDLIREKQGLISATGNNEDLSKKTAILKNISLINSLIEDNRKKIDELTIQARKLGKENNALSRIADLTKARIKKQEAEIEELKARLQEESYKVVDLNKRMDEMQLSSEMLLSEKNQLAEGNAQLDRDLNKVYFTYGTYAELKTKQLIEKKGGFLGVGKKDALSNAFHRNKASFTELDLRETSSIPIRGRKPRLVTSHPEGSYEWKKASADDEYSNLLIKDAGDFWSRSRYLVVEVK